MFEGYHQTEKIVHTSTSFVERASEFRYFLLIMSLIFLLDNCFLIFYEKNLLAFSKSLSSLDFQLGNAIVFIGIFAFLMAFFFPSLRLIMRLGSIYVYYLWFWDANKARIKDYRRSGSVKEQALKEKDPFLLALVEKHEQKVREQEINLDVGFGLCVLFLVNFLILGSSAMPSLSGLFAGHLDHVQGFWLARLLNAVGGAFVLLVLYIFYRALDPRPNDEMDVPRNPEKKNECSPAKDTPNKSGEQKMVASPD